GEVYNIGGGNQVKNVDLTHRILELVGKPASLIKPVADRPGHDRRYSLSTAKLESLGWKPREDFAHGLAGTVRWYRENEARRRAPRSSSTAPASPTCTTHGKRPRGRCASTCSARTTCSRPAATQDCRAASLSPARRSSTARRPRRSPRTIPSRRPHPTASAS